MQPQATCAVRAGPDSKKGPWWEEGCCLSCAPWWRAGMPSTTVPRCGWCARAPRVRAARRATTPCCAVQDIGAISSRACSISHALRRRGPRARCPCRAAACSVHRNPRPRVAASRCEGQPVPGLAITLARGPPPARTHACASHRHGMDPPPQPLREPMDAFFCKLASAVRLNFGSGLSRTGRADMHELQPSARARTHAPAFSITITIPHNVRCAKQRSTQTCARRIARNFSCVSTSSRPAMPAA